MRELQRLRMQRLAPESAQGLDQFRVAPLGSFSGPPYSGSPTIGMLEMRHVHADLVGAPGFQPAFEQRVRAEALAQAEMGDRIAAIVAHGHADAVARMAVDRRIGGAAGHQRADHHRQVLAMHFARGQLFDQRGVRRQRARDDHDAGGVLVEAVDDAGARQRVERRIAMQQRIDQRAGRIAGAGMHDQARRLVDDEDVLVLVQHVEGDVLGLANGSAFEHDVRA